MIDTDYHKQFDEAIQQMEREQESYWNSLSKEQQLKCFCAIARRIYEGEVEKQGSYRYVLYDVFGFGPEAYLQAQVAGYLTIHNCIFTSQQEQKLLQEFAQHCGLENSEAAVDSWYMKQS